MKKNIGTIDALMRLTAGLTGVAWGTAQMVRHPHRSLPTIVTMLSAMKVAEGITRFCPVIAMIEQKTEKALVPDHQEQKQEKEEQGISPFQDQSESTAYHHYSRPEH